MREVIIIGGGVGGLACALFLKKIAINPIIYEADEAINLEGGLQIAPNGMRILDHLGLAAKVAAVGNNCFGLSFYNHKGDKLSKLNHQNPDKYGFPAINLSRRAFMSVLLDECASQGVEIHFNKKLQDIDRADSERPIAIFTDGTTVEAEVIIGADGLNSRVRTCIFPDASPLEYTGLTMFGGFLPAASLAGTQLPDTQLFELTFGRSGLFGCGLGQDQGNELVLWWSLTTQEQLTSEAMAAMTPEDVRSLLIKEQAEWHEPIPTIIKNFEQVFKWRVYDMKALPAWSRGNVILIGDAAHVASPNSAQGASMALEDAMFLVNLFRTKPNLSVQAIGRELEKARKDRVKAVVKEGRRAAEHKGKLGAAASWMRDRFVQLLLPSVLKSACKKLYRYQIEWDLPTPAANSRSPMIEASSSGSSQLPPPAQRSESEHTEAVASAELSDKARLQFFQAPSANPASGVEEVSTSASLANKPG